MAREGWRGGWILIIVSYLCLVLSNTVCFTPGPGQARPGVDCTGADSVNDCVWSLERRKQEDWDLARWEECHVEGRLGAS